MSSPLAVFRLEEYFRKWEFQAKYHLTASDAQTFELREILDLAGDEDRDAWERLTLGYREVEGDAGLREAIASTYERIAPEDVLCFAGAEEGLWCAMHALLEEGGNAVVTVPNYQSMESIPLSIASASGVALREKANWSLDLDELQAALRPESTLIAINFPNNPTGAIADCATFDAIVALASQRELHLFSDEVYRGIETVPSKRLPQAADAYERGISLGATSKAYGLPGLRVGWIACRDRALLGRMGRLKHYLSICNAGPSEILARIALRAQDAIVGRNMQIIRHNLALLGKFFGEHRDRFEWYEPDGGCVSFPRYLGSEGVERFCSRLVEEYGILLLPSSIYQSQLLTTPRDRFRIGFGRRGMSPALAQFETAL